MGRLEGYKKLGIYLGGNDLANAGDMDLEDRIASLVGEVVNFRERAGEKGLVCCFFVPLRRIDVPQKRVDMYVGALKAESVWIEALEGVDESFYGQILKFYWHKFAHS